MKKSISDYLITLSNDDFNQLERIMVYKYFKLKTLYFMIKDYSEYISAIKYKDDEENDKLKIEIHFSQKLNMKKFLDDVDDSIKNNDILIKNIKKNIYIEIRQKEFY